MMKKSKIVVAFLAPITLLSLCAFASQNNTSNYAGTTGIFETPNTRIMPDWSMRMFVNLDS